MLWAVVNRSTSPSSLRCKHTAYAWMTATDSEFCSGVFDEFRNISNMLYWLETSTVLWCLAKWSLWDGWWNGMGWGGWIEGGRTQTPHPPDPGLQPLKDSTILILGGKISIQLFCYTSWSWWVESKSWVPCGVVVVSAGKCYNRGIMRYLAILLWHSAGSHGAGNGRKEGEGRGRKVLCVKELLRRGVCRKWSKWECCHLFTRKAR